MILQAAVFVFSFHAPKAGVDAELPNAGVEDAPNAGADEPVAVYMSDEYKIVTRNQPGNRGDMLA